MKITIIIYTRLFILFPNLIAKESYNWWVTRRVWGFRQQISKAKYLKISQNVDRTYRETLGEHRGTVQNWLRNSQVSAIRGSGYVYLEKLKCPFLPSGYVCRMWNIRRRWTSPGYNSGYDTSGWKVAAADFRMWYIRVEVAAAGWNGGNSRMEWRRQLDGIPTRVEWAMIPFWVEWAGSHTPCILDLLMDSK